MPKLPVVSGLETVRALERAGFLVSHQTGSHVSLRHMETGRTVSVPVHGGRDLPTGTVRGIIRDAGLTVVEFCELLG